jgi:hypothetical protein
LQCAAADRSFAERVHETSLQWTWLRFKSVKSTLPAIPTVRSISACAAVSTVSTVPAELRMLCASSVWMLKMPRFQITGCGQARNTFRFVVEQ